MLQLLPFTNKMNLMVTGLGIFIFFNPFFISSMILELFVFGGKYFPSFTCGDYITLMRIEMC